MSADTELLTPGELSERIRIPEKTLAQWRWAGTGPAYLKLGGAVRYRRSVIEQWEHDCEHAPQPAA